MKHASKRIMVFAVACTFCAIGFGVTAVYAAYSGNNTARHEASASITNAQCIGCHAETVTTDSLDPAVSTAHAVHLDSPLLRFDTMSDGCATCHESTDIEQGSGATVNMQVDTEICANCHGTSRSAAHHTAAMVPGCSGWQCHDTGCDECHAPGSANDPAAKHAAMVFIDADAASDPASCPKCHGGLALYAVMDRVPVDIITATVKGNGSISPSGVRTVDVGDDAAYVIAPDTGSHLVEVLVDGVSVGLRTAYTFSDVTDDHTISASFALDTFSVTSSVGANGSISPLGVSTVDYGSDATYTITPAAGYGIADVVVDGVSRGAISTYAFADVHGDHTISATFKRVTRLTITSSRTTIRRGQTVRYSGAISPRMANGTRVVVQIRKSGSSTWSRLSTRSTYSGRLWAYSYTPRTRARGTYYVRVTYGGSAAFLPSRSVSKKLVIR